VWSDTDVAAGSNWKEEINRRLEEADIVLLMISSSFLAADFLWESEAFRAIERHEAGTAFVVPILLRPSDWSATPLAKLSALPPDGIPISKHRDTDEAWALVAREIRKLSKTVSLARRGRP
jgi:hypothetical protein